MTNTNNKNHLTVRELIAILETHNSDAVINVRSDLDIWVGVTNDDVTAHSEECMDYVFIG
jgi:hypothetical protein